MSFFLLLIQFEISRGRSFVGKFYALHYKSVSINIRQELTPNGGPQFSNSTNPDTKSCQAGTSET